MNAVWNALIGMICLAGLLFPSPAGAEQACSLPLTILSLPAVHVAAVSRSGPRSEARSAFYDLYNRAEPAGLLSGDNVFVGLAYDRIDRSTVSRWHYQAGVAVSGRVDPTWGLSTVEIPAGTYAVAQYRGHPEGLGSIYRAMEVSLAAKGLNIADSPCLEVSMRPPMLTPPSQEVIYVLLPIKQGGL